MSSYQYSKLVDADTRLLILLPGQLNSDIKTQTYHAPLTAPPDRPRQQVTLDELWESPSLLARVQAQYAELVESVYRDRFLAMTDQMQRLHFEFCSLRTSQARQLPSWVPDFYDDLVELLFRGGRYASGMSCSHATYQAPGALYMSGVQVGTVKSNKGVYPD